MLLFRTSKGFSLFLNPDLVPVGTLIVLDTGVGDLVISFGDGKAYPVG